MFDFSPKLIGVVHLLPLPGSPRWGGDLEAVIAAAQADVEAYLAGGADALIIENFGDVPFTNGPAPAETIATMAAVATAVRLAVDLRTPFGFNVLRNDPLAGLAIAAAASGAFIRVNVHSGSMVTDQGVIHGNAYETLRARARLCPKVRIFADVLVKHAHPLAPIPVDEAAKDTLHRGLADALILSGVATGAPVDVEQLRLARAACPDAMLLVGSGATADNAARLLCYADGLIVGASLKRGGRLDQPVDPDRVRRLREAVDSVPSRE